ncbi:MAG: hypothetical protein F6K48_22565 [Okeania sp. SIO3H1]|nr:hypothetical protein [Okeania sp. SIO3H1]
MSQFKSFIWVWTLTKQPQWDFGCGKETILIYFLGGVHYSRINAVAISPNTQIGVTGSKGGNVKIWRKDERVKNF